MLLSNKQGRFARFHKNKANPPIVFSYFSIKKTAAPSDFY